MTPRHPLVLLALAIAVASATPAGACTPAVGVTTLTFTKTSVSNGRPRTLETTVWYPAVCGTGTAETLGQRDAKIRRGRFPLLVFSHGACGRPREATYLTTALARRGFVVAAPRHPGNTAEDFPYCFSDEAVAEAFLNRVPDVQFVIDGMLAENDAGGSRFHRRLRPERIGMTGLSFGGFTTLLTAQLEPRVTAALALVPGGSAVLGPNDITIPTMVIGAEDDTITGWAEAVSAYERLAGPRYLVRLLGANHLSAVDDCFNHDLNVDLCDPEAISQEEAHRLILRYAVPFLERWVKGRKPAGRQVVRPVTGVELETAR
jgi:predicted dienelactone hydrolase